MKKEFYDTRYQAPITDIREETEKRCRAPFELMPHQIFVKNFLSMQTPYNSLLLYHGLGTGKTLSAIGIAEEMRSYMKQVGMNKRILVLASPNVINNFQLQLFDENRLYQDNGMWHGHTSISQALLDEINPSHLKNMNKAQLIANVKAVIKTYYEFKGYIKFSNEVAVALKPFSATDPARIRKIQAMFNNHLIIIDEVHNIRLTRDNQDLTTANYLMLIAKYAKNVRFILLSATPMYNSYKEIVWLSNLMNVNDHRSEITAEQIFTKTGDFRPEGEALLRKSLTGYVSYVRSENPYTFPFRLYQANRELPVSDPFLAKYPALYLNRMGAAQDKAYRLILSRISPGAAAAPSPLPSPSAALQRGGDEGEGAGAGSPPPPSPEDMAKALRDTLDTLDNVGYEYLRVPIQALNIVYQDVPSVQADNINTDTLVGKQGLETVVTMTPKKQFTYLSDKVGFFKSDRLPPFSQKIAAILDHIRGSTGIVMIYSEFIFGGIVPMALALEEAGFARAHGVRSQTTSLFTTRPAASNGLHYAMITGDKDFSPDNREELALINDPQNRYGERIKVVLISRAGGEGLDFKNIRQIHILEPWYNMSRIEQIIGRGVRNHSHCDLPFEERNVEIYMHATQIPQDALPAADTYLYELSFKKAHQIGKVSKVLKSIAVDCLLNRDQQLFTVERLAEIPANRQLSLRTSTSEGEVAFQPGDRPYTAVCDYSDTCAIPCQSAVSEEELAAQQNTTTYSVQFLQTNRIRIVEIVRQLFRAQLYYPSDMLIQAIQRQHSYPIEQIYYALTYLLKNRNEYLVDSHGRLGRLINRGEIYAFQPVEISDESISVFDRTFPVEPKVAKIRLELDTQTVSAPESHFPREVRPPGNVETGVAPPLAVAASSAASSQPPQGESYTSLLEGLARAMEEIRTMFDLQTKMPEKPAGRKAAAAAAAATPAPPPRQTWNDYMHAGSVLVPLQRHFGLTLRDVQRMMLHHAVDVLPGTAKRILADQLLRTDSEAEAEAPPRPDDWIAPEVQEYMSKRVHLIQNRPILVLANDKNAWDVFKRAEDGASWVPGQYTDVQLVQRNVVEPMRKSLEPRQEHLAPLVGFIMTETVKERWGSAPIFKVKDFTRKTVSRAAKGENMLKAGKKREVELVRLALTTLEEQGVEGAKAAQSEKFEEHRYSQGALNVLTELLLRHATTEQRRSFMNPEEYAILNVMF
jgi:superfamily II DNA or RNA helicase